MQSRQITELAADLAVHEAAGDYLAVIEGVRELVAQDRAAVKDPWVKGWIGRRWRDLFIQEAVKDEQAVNEASKPTLLSLRLPVSVPGFKKSNPRQAIAERFLKDAPASEWQAELPEAQYDTIENTTLIICGGLLTGMLFPGAHPLHLESERLFKERGWRMVRADSHPVRSCEANEADLEAAFRGEGLNGLTGGPIEDPTPPDKVFLLGYSKGAPDILSFLVHRPEYHKQIKGVFTWGGAIGGSYTADGMYDQIKDLPTTGSVEYVTRLLSLISPALSGVGLRRLDEFDVKGALYDLRTDVREAFTNEHAEYLDGLGIPIFALTGATTPLEVPSIQFTDAVRLSGYDANNDMQLTQRQSLLPIGMNTHIAMAHAHHWDISYAAFPLAMRALSPNLDHPWPRYAALVANWEILAELGLID